MAKKERDRMTPKLQASREAPAADCRWVVAEVAAILLLFFLYAGSQPPNVNEAHYLAKAKHFWNPDWCAGDHFLASPNAHVVFNGTFGWLTLLLPLPATTWAGRIVTWTLLAWSWQRLSFALIPRVFVAPLSAGVFLATADAFHMAGEWIVGGVEAKGFAFVLVFFALESIVRGRWQRGWLLLGAASAFHVLVGGWSMVAAGFCWLLEGQRRPRLKSTVPAWAAAFVLALPGLVPAVGLTWGVDAATAGRANEIYVYGRLSHHLVPHTFAPWIVGLPPPLAEYELVLPSVLILRHLGLLVVWGIYFRFGCRGLGQNRLQRFVGGAVCIALIGGVIDVATIPFPSTGAALLRYYWFRLSDVMLPAGISIGLLAMLTEAAETRPWAKWCLAAGAVVVLLLLADVQRSRWRDPRPPADIQSLPRLHDGKHAAQPIYRAWRRTCDWINKNTHAGGRFLTPRSQQTFKWYAGRSEVVTWKDIPQDAPSLVAWSRRYAEIFPRPVFETNLAAHGESRLDKLAQKYDAQYVIIDRTRSSAGLTWPRVYPDANEANEFYEVYRVPADGASQ